MLRFIEASFTHLTINYNNQGRIQKFQKGGAGSRILERGGRNLTFQSFSYKSLTNIPPKGGGGGAARRAPPLNPRLIITI